MKNRIKKLFGLKQVTIRNTHSFPDNIIYSSLINEVFNKIKLIHGWFNIDDCAHFNIFMSYQSVLGIRGDLMEIGSYFGRSTSMMAWCLKEDEKIFVCDAFEIKTEDTYKLNPTPEKVLENIQKVNPSLSKDRIVIKKCLSNNLKLEEDKLFRFIHIDGGHSKDQVIFDLNLSKKHLLKGGIIAVDDYQNKDWPEVTVGIDQFISQNKDMKIVADLNRYGAKGRKIYLSKIT